MNNTDKNNRSITVSNSLVDCDKLFAFLEELASRIGLAEDTYNDLKLAIDETFVNIVSYAFDEDRSHDIVMESHHSDHRIDITFIDNGIAFDPLNDSNKTMDQDNLDKGGMGIHIIRSITDEQRYERIDQRNVFTLTKHYTK
jgi:anti-sigma regulatory factor (Ser/Thr protein kinase)